MIVVAAALLAAGAAPADAARLPFGFNEEYVRLDNGATPEEKVALTADAGGGLARTSMDWRCFEPVRDQWDEACWAGFAAFYDRALDQDIRPIFTLIASPKWAQAHPCRRRFSRNCAVPPARRYDGEWREFAGAAARRFPRAIFEVWNEPNIKAFWNGRPRPVRYAELVRIAYRAVKRGSEGRATVLAGSVVGTDQNTDKVMGSERFLGRAFRSGRGMRRNLDGLSFHMYGLSQGLGRGSYFRNTMDRMRGIADRYLSGKRERLWISETGTSRGFPESLSAGEQKQRLWHLWRLLSRMNIVRGVVFHRLIQPKETDDSEWQHGLAWTRYRPFARFPRPIKPKPVFCRFSRRLGSRYEPCNGLR